MDYDLERGRTRSGTGRSRHRDGVIELDMDTRRGMRRGSGPTLSTAPQKKPSKTRRRVIAMIIAECFALLFIGSYGFFARRWNMIQRVDDWVPEEIENPNFSVDLPQYEKQKGHWGIYIFGVDSRGTNVGKGTNADVNIICDIDHDSGEIRLVSVFRDTYLNINDSGSYNKINQAYFEGGPTMAAKMLNKNLDLNISDFVTFNWKAVADGINILGGVDMEISKAEFYYINSFITETAEATGIYSEQLTHAGMNHLNGVQAVAYGRLRLMDTDFARTERQRKVIQAAFEKAKQADLATLNELTLALFPQVATSVDIQDLLSLVGDVGKYHIGETGGFPFARGDKNMGKKGACVIPQTLETNVKELHAFLYGEENYLLSDTVQTLSAKISNDTGMYTQGVSVGHVSTSGGVIPSNTRPAKTDSSESKPKATKEETEEETTETKEDQSSAAGEGQDGTEAGDPTRPGTGTSPTRETLENGGTGTSPTRENPDGGGTGTSTGDSPAGRPGTGTTSPAGGTGTTGGQNGGSYPGNGQTGNGQNGGLYPSLPGAGTGQGGQNANGPAGSTGGTSDSGNGVTPGESNGDMPTGGNGNTSAGGTGNGPAGSGGNTPAGSTGIPAGGTGGPAGGGSGTSADTPTAPAGGGSTGTAGPGSPGAGPTAPGGGDILTVPEGPGL